MTVECTIESLLRSPAVHSCEGVLPAVLERHLQAASWRFPNLHCDLLCESDGILGYGGYYRVFGISRLISWNSNASWKASWPSHVQDYVCFAESGWGDQYAYRAEELRGSAEPRIYFLESFTMCPEEICASFGAFLFGEFLPCCKSPYDELLVAARNKIGDLCLDEHVIQAPSPLITGMESVDLVMKVSAIASMTINGDISRQLQVAR